MAGMTPEPPGVELDARRLELARACRVLAARGLVDDVLGHVSERVGAGQFLVRCRGPQERGLRFTVPADIRLLALADADRLVGADVGAGYRAPNELPIHAETLRRRADVGAVVHAHPRTVVTASLAALTLRPVIGAYHIPAMRLAEGGIPTYPRAVLITRASLAAEMLDAMGDRPACVLRGHGLVTAAATLPAAVLTALAVNVLAGLHLDAARVGVVPPELPPSDRAELPDLGAAFNEALLWRHELASLAADGFDIAEDTRPDEPGAAGEERT